MKQGRESKVANDIFYTCSLVDYIARLTHNTRADVLDALGSDRLERVLELADVYHSDNIDAVADSFITEAHIQSGAFDNVGAARYTVPSHWDIGKVYKRLVLAIMEHEGVDAIEALNRAYHSPVAVLIDDYNGSFYYESPQAIWSAYATGEVE